MNEAMFLATYYPKYPGKLCTWKKLRHISYGVFAIHYRDLRRVNNN